MMIVRSIFFFKQKTAYEMRISDWSADVCSSYLDQQRRQHLRTTSGAERRQPCGSHAARLSRPHRGGVPEPGLGDPRRAALHLGRSAERSVGKVCVSSCSTRCAPDHNNKNIQSIL